MTRERWEELKKKYASLEVTFNKKKFANVKCLKCSKISVESDNKFYCNSCLINSDAEALKEYLKIDEAIRLFDQMVFMGIMTHNGIGYLPNYEFMEYLKECMKRNYETTGITKGIGLRILRLLTMMQDGG